MKKIYLWSKNIHRWAMWTAIVFGAIMGVTGLAMEAALEGEHEWLFTWLNRSLVRRTHVEFGKWLVLSLAIMIVTGLVLWIYPLWIQWKNKVNNSSINRKV